MVKLKKPEYVIVSKLRAKDLGNPKMAAALPEGDDRVVWLGTIIGRAAGVKKFVDPQDETKVAWALKGVFEAQPENIDQNGNLIDEKFRKPVTRAGIAWLPTNYHEMVVDAVTGGDPNTKIPNIVSFKVRIGTKRSTNRAGYEYSIEYESDVSAADDPLADLRAPVVPQIEHKPVAEIDTSAGDADKETEAGTDSGAGDEETTTRRRGRGR